MFALKTNVLNLSGGFASAAENMPGDLLQILKNRFGGFLKMTRILVVDDEDGIRDVVSNYLEFEGNDYMFWML